MNVLKHEEKLAVLSALVEGNSVRSTVRMTGVHKTTILRLIEDVGGSCGKIMDERMRGLRCVEIEADELWCYVGKKQRRLTDAEKAAGKLGNAYTFIAFGPHTKLIPDFRVGKRDWGTTDAFNIYPDAVERAFGADVDYGQIVKSYAPEDGGRGRYSPPAVIGVEKIAVAGQPEPSRICTSYVERNNLTIPMQLRRFTRLTNGFSKKLANLKVMVALFICYYNFCRIHGSLRVTPAMAAGITDHVWDLEELVA